MDEIEVQRGNIRYNMEQISEDILHRSFKAEIFLKIKQSYLFFFLKEKIF